MLYLLIILSLIGITLLFVRINKMRVNIYGSSEITLEDKYPNVGDTIRIDDQYFKVINVEDTVVTVAYDPH